MLRTLCLENGNNELFICWLSVFQKRKSLKTFCILKQFGRSFLLFFFLFSPISLQASAFTALGIGNINWIFLSERKLAFLRGISKSPEEEKSSPGGILSLWCQTHQPMVDLDHREIAPQKKWVCPNCDLMLCIREEAALQFLVLVSSGNPCGASRGL